MTVGSEEDLQGLMRIGRIVGLTIKAMQEALRPGITTAELDAIGAAFLAKHGARSAPQLMYNFPGATCISINDEAAHGIPGDRKVQPGDLVNIDVSAELDGYFADSGASIPVPPVSEENQRLCNATMAALERALDAVTAGKRINVIGRAVEIEAQRSGFNIIRELGGHGIGRRLHEEPRNVPNYFTKRASQPLVEGMVLTIEPFLTPGVGRVITAPDGWTLRTPHGAPSAQYEHTIVITKGKPLLLTAV
ncbi:MAG: type I methionyl aminopeptidase [Chloroflexota bacterium]|nr:MAG: type I methionyl aminopeptidase [Chloroflexota bacterium]